MAAGIRGSVMKLTGDFMPLIGHGHRNNSTNPHQNVFVIALCAPISEEELKSHSSSFESIESHPKFIKMTQTRSEGTYQFDLPVGLKVTIVAWIKNKPYLNLYNISGAWSSIQVPESGYITFNI
jgi:hypothetical protein